MKSHNALISTFFLGLVVSHIGATVSRAVNSPKRIRLAASDASLAQKSRADQIVTGTNDEKMINDAIARLPPEGGTVTLSPGTYKIHAVKETLGGITIDRSNVTLEGSGTATILHLEDHQNINVIRIIGDGLENIVVRNLRIDGNWEKNDGSLERFETCGVKAASLTERPLKNIVVENTRIEDCASLNVLLWGEGVQIRNNFLGDALRDVAEVIGGPGVISGNYVEIDNITGYGLGSDSTSHVRIKNNIVRVIKSGEITQSVFRTWGGQYENIISGNEVYAEDASRIKSMVRALGYKNLISNNTFHQNPHFPRSTVSINSGSLLNGNFLENCDIEVIKTAEWDSVIINNLFLNTQISSYPPGTTIQNNTILH